MENSILSLPPGEFLFALNELGLPDDQREFLLSQYGAPEPRPPVPEGRSFGYHLLDNIIGFDDDYVTRGEAWRAGVQDTLSEFVSPEAGQRRRAALDRVDQRINDALDYYLGPQLAPRVEQAANIGALFSPGMDVQDAVQASGEMVAPNRTPLDRAASGAALAGSLAAMFMPGGVSSIRQGVEDVADAAVRAYDPNTTNAFTVWHGSPHDFDRFSMDKIGTGEGAQAYGHGLYFSESPSVAKTYQGKVSAMQGQRATIGGAPVNWDDPRQYAAFELWRHNGDAAAAADFAERTFNNTEAAMLLRGGFDLPVIDPPGRLYEVSIDANPEDFLDWDRPLSEQPEIAQRLGVDPNANARRAEEIRARVSEDMRLEGRTTPDEIDQRNLDLAAELELLSVTGDASSYAPRSIQMVDELKAKGIPGIRYLDAGSRDAGEGSRNYVVFNDQLLSILNKYGLAGGAGLASLALMGEEDSADNY